jgi:putative transposase
MDVSMMARMKKLKDENRWLKKMYADAGGCTKGGHDKKVVRPSQRREMAKWAVEHKSTHIVLACAAFAISQTCYRYTAKPFSENDEFDDWLVRLTDNHRNWEFGLCILYLRNVKGLPRNHKHAYRIYRELELNLRINASSRKAVGSREAAAVGCA